MQFTSFTDPKDYVLKSKLNEAEALANDSITTAVPNNDTPSDDTKEKPLIINQYDPNAKKSIKMNEATKALIWEHMDMTDIPTVNAVCAMNEAGKMLAYIRINDENILASPVHLRLWREQQSPRPVVTTFEESHTLVLETLQNNPPMTLNQLTRRTRLPRQQVINLLARFIRYDLAQWKYDAHQFLFSAR